MATLSVRALIVFRGNEKQYWLKPFTDTKLGHCGILVDHGMKVYDSHNLYTYLDDSFTSTLVQPVLLLNEGEDLKVLFPDATSVLSVHVEFDKDKYTVRGIMSCVSVVKHILGIGEPLVWTPKQLHKLLTKEYGAIELLK